MVGKFRGLVATPARKDAAIMRWCTTSASSPNTLNPGVLLLAAPSTLEVTGK